MSDLNLKIAEWRARCAPGHPNPMTLEEYREAIKSLRAGREAVPAATGGSKTRAKASKAPVNSDDLLSQLEGL